MRITPYIAGRGMAGTAMARALAVVAQNEPVYDIAPPVFLDRGARMADLAERAESSLLCVANPHALHASMLIDADAAGLGWILTDKPVCTEVDDIPRLRQVRAHVAVCHGFRQQWGPQTLRQFVDAGEFGAIVAIEARYWQSSAAAAALAGHPSTAKDWKNDLSLNGPYDTLVDLGAHVADLLCFLAGERPVASRVHVSHVNAAARHRDTHAHIEIEFEGFRSVGSVSKTAHGAGNDFEIVVIGSAMSATWRVTRPDELWLGTGGQTVVLPRGDWPFGSRQPTFHGLGWLEGYVGVVEGLLHHMAGGPVRYPTLAESLVATEALLAPAKKGDTHVFGVSDDRHA